MFLQDMTNEEVKGGLRTLVRALKAQINRDVVPRVNDLESTVSSM